MPYSYQYREDTWKRLANGMTIPSLKDHCRHMSMEARELDPIDIQLGTDKAGQLRDQISVYRNVIAHRENETRRTVSMNLTPLEADIIRQRRQLESR